MRSFVTLAALPVLGASLAACSSPAPADDASLDADAHVTDTGLTDGATALVPTSPQLVFPATQGTHDEDPSLLRARDGTFYLAWLSDRDGNDDVYVTRSTDARTWAPPIRVTHHPDPDWYPSLVQTTDGRFHVSWFRPMTVSPFYRHVYANDSDDGVTWDAQREVQVTDGVADDWAPMMVEAPAGTLSVYYSSQARGTSHTMDLYVSRSMDQGAHWDAPVALPSLSDPAEMDMFPFVVARAPGDLVMVWERYASSAAMNYFDPSSDLFYATSSDGITWTGVVPITHDDGSMLVDAIPSLYLRDDTSSWDLLWTSTGPMPGGSPKVLDLPLDDHGDYPQGVIDATAAHGMNGYSARAVATSTPGIYLGVWVQDVSGSKRLFWQLFAR